MVYCCRKRRRNKKGERIQDEEMALAESRMASSVPPSRSGFPDSGLPRGWDDNTIIIKAPEAPPPKDRATVRKIIPDDRDPRGLPQKAPTGPVATFEEPKKGYFDRLKSARPSSLLSSTNKSLDKATSVKKSVTTDTKAVSDTGESAKMLKN